MPLHHILTFFNTATAFEDGKRKRLLANNPHPQHCAGFAILLSHTLGICNSDAHLKCATHPQPNYKFGKTWEYAAFRAANKAKHGMEKANAAQNKGKHGVCVSVHVKKNAKHSVFRLKQFCKRQKTQYLTPNNFVNGKRLSI